MPDAHSEYSASRAPRYTRCYGSIALEATVENKSSDFADEGTAAHELGALCLEQGQPTIAFAGRLIKVNGKSYEVGEDMIDNVQRYVDYCSNLISLSTMYGVEADVDFSNWLSKEGQGGRSDFWALVGTELHVVDLKYGMGVQVDAEQNEQGMSYALGVLNELEFIAEVETVRIVIHQPRKGHLDEWTCTVDHLKEFADRAAFAVSQCEAAKFLYPTDPEAFEKYLTPGEKQCKFCNAKAVCPALRQEVLNTVSAVGPTPDDFSDLTLLDPVQTVARAEELGVGIDLGDVLAAILPKLDMISDWVDAMKTYAHREMLNGRAIPGYKLVAGKRGARQWSDAGAAEAAFKSMRLKQDEMYDFKLISPTSAEKLLKDTPKRWNRISPLIVQKDGAPTIAPASDKREALVIGKPEDDFVNLDEAEAELA